jgi:hypothetical protein
MKLLFNANVMLTPVHSRKEYGGKVIVPLVINLSSREVRQVTLDFRPLCTRTHSKYMYTQQIHIYVCICCVTGLDDLERG